MKTYVESYTNHKAVVKEKDRLAKVSKRIEIESANAAAALRKAKQQLRGRMKNINILNGTIRKSIFFLTKIRVIRVWGKI